MHRQKSTQTLRSLKLGACHFLANIILALTGIGFIAAGLITQVKQWTCIGSALIVVWALSVFLFFILSYTFSCPLCMGKLWVRPSCRRHRKAVQTLGVSYRLGIASSVILGKAYRCPYCGEPFSSTKSRK